jgi:hypothetical protein
VAGSQLPEPDVERVRRWCRQRVPEHLRDRVRVECDAGPGHLTIVECRPPWRNDMSPDWTRFPIARLRYTKAAKPVDWPHIVADLLLASARVTAVLAPDPVHHGEG